MFVLLDVCFRFLLKYVLILVYEIETLLNHVLNLSFQFLINDFRFYAVSFMSIYFKIFGAFLYYHV